MQKTRKDPADAVAPSGSRLEGDERFTLLGLLGEGGMGKVLAYEDRALERKVAVKIARPETGSMGKSTLEREARIIGQLDHPHIVPVYDIGEDPEWGTFYVMPLLEQPTLEDALASLRKGEGEHTHGKLLRLFVQVCQAVDYAHHRGFVHCDLKPENILLGSFGEVFVVDWGFAYRPGEESRPRGGTPGFMSPEQLARQKGAVDRRTDVFALGAILYQLLTDERPFESVGFEEWADAVAKGKPGLAPAVSPAARAKDRKVPPELDELCMRALELDRDRRLASAKELSVALDAFLEGTKAKKRRAKHAAELVEQAEALAESHRDLLASRPERLAELAAIRARVAPWETGDAKTELLDAEDRVAVLDALAARSFQTAASLFERALDEVQDHEPARAGLSGLYWEASERALLRGDELERKHYEALALDHDDGSLGARLDRGGSIAIATTGRDGAEIVLAEMEERGGRLVVGAEQMRERGSVGPIHVQASRWLATIRARGCADVRVPIFVRPGAAAEIAVDLSSAPGHDDEILVVGGPALVGGHEASLHGNELREVVVPAFVVSQLPVTFRAWLVFLDHLVGDDASALDACVPRTEQGDVLWSRASGTWSPAPALLGVAGDGLLVDGIAGLPAFGMDRDAAEAFAAWHAKKTGLPWRLPSELEWEKAARGADGRRHPWGDRFDASHCKMRQSRAGRPRPEAPGAFEADASPYGVRDLAGGIAEWVAPSADAPSTSAVSRGGAWCDWPGDCHAGARRTYLAGERTTRVGLRLARSC